MFTEMNAPESFEVSNNPSYEMSISGMHRNICLEMSPTRGHLGRESAQIGDASHTDHDATNSEANEIETDIYSTIYESIPN